MKNNKITSLTVFTAILLAFLTSCKSQKVDYTYPVPYNQRGDDYYGSVAGKDQDHLTLFETGRGKKGDISMPINPYLWRASTDSLSFMPLMSSDALGGTIITDWYDDPKSPGERFKFNVIITGQELTPLSLKVSGFRQVNKNGTWTNAPINPNLVDQLEDTILTRARKLKIQDK
jgi:hypothetical protein